MPDDERAAGERRTTADEMLLGYLDDGLRPAEIAVRLGIPVGDVHARIARLAGSAAALQPDAAAPSPVSTAPPDAPVEEHHTDSRVPLALLGVVAAAFVVAIAIFLVRESQQAGERAGAIDRNGGSVPPAIAQPTPTAMPTPASIDGVQLERMTLGPPVDLPRGVALMVWGFCDQCQQVTTYVQGPRGLESYPVEFHLPGDAQVFLAAATPDGATVIVNAYWDSGPSESGSAVFRSDDAGASWVEAWRGPLGWGVVRVGAQHVALHNPETNRFRIVPGDVEVEEFDPLLDELTPLRVYRSIEREGDVDPEFPVPRARSRDGETYVTNVRREIITLPPGEFEPEPALGILDSADKLQRGWSGWAVLPVGVILDDHVLLSAVLSEAGTFRHNSDDPTYLRASIFDLASGTVHPIALPDVQPNTNMFVLSVREGPFLRVPRGVAGCLPVAASIGGAGEPVACAAPNTLLRDTGRRGTAAATDWAEVEVPGGPRGWVPLGDVVVLPR
ncbi:MAG: hypothetical protein WD557_05700 [Dehalococcoidia bacterium]